MKKCRTCEKIFPLSHFYKDNRNTTNSEVADCKNCWQKKKLINKRFKRRFGITVLAYRLKKDNFAVNFPELLKEWNYNKNNKLKLYPDKLFQTSTKKVWWKCKIHGEYEQPLQAKASGSGCIDCGNLIVAEKVTKRSLKKFGNLQKSFPDLFLEVDFNLHTKEEILKKSVYTHEVINWKCKKCGHKWSTSMKNRTRNKSNCRKCSGGVVSRNEYRLYCELSYLFKKVYISHKVYKRKYVDIYIKDLNLVVEYDGHHFHKNSLDQDFFINKKIKDLNYKIIRIREHNLSKINDLDLIIKKTDTSNKNQIKITLLLIKKIKDHFKKFISDEVYNKLDDYLKNKTFMNNSLYNDFISCLPYPPLQESIEYLNPRSKKFWDFKKNFPLKPCMFRQNDKTMIWIKCSKNHSEKIKVFDLNRRINRKSYNNKICRFC